jgi:hypothetical protein
MLGDIVCMKLARIILIIAEILFVLLLLFAPAVESRPFARAIVAYQHDPSPQNAQDLEQQREIVRNRRVRESIVIAALLAANSAGLFYVTRRLHGRVVA